jgi:RNA polymerase sigma-70 factor, ECF subfamily
MADEFEQRVAPYRRELLAHCYRMTGSLSDAEDALQDALVRAWRGLADFEARSSLRTWLYRIATNACIDLIADRRGRTLPDRVADDDGEPRWLEPFPDALIDDDGPAAIYARREATRLAFVAALQRLPPRQRAMLILRDVVGLSAEEAAAALDVSVASGTSLLQRAREALEQPARRREPPEPAALAELLARFVRAWERGDARELIALLRHDALTTMPPVRLWFRGAGAIVEYMAAHVFPDGPVQLVPIALNAGPGFAIYRRGAFAALTVLDVEGDAIAAFHSFMAVDPARYQLAVSYRT